MRNKHAAIVLDLEPDHAGLAEVSYQGWNTRYVSRLFRLLGRHNVPLTVFVVGKSLLSHASAIRYIKKFGSELHLHSYSHILREPDSDREITKGIKTFVKHIGVRPMGYRAPQGLISDEGLDRLKKHGFSFDASVFPSFWPHPRYAAFPTTPFTTARGVREIPNTAVGPMRLLLTLSWIKLLGWPVYRWHISRFDLPETVVFSFHLHDVFPLKAAQTLPLFWKIIYSRNHSRGLQLLDTSLKLLHELGYQFVPISKLVSS